MRKNIWRGFCYLFAALILLGSTAGTALEANRNVVDGFLGTKSYTVVTEGSGELYTSFTADYSSTDELVAAHRAMGEQLMEEGAVLLKNNGGLPLQTQARSVTLLGMKADASTLHGATVGVSVPASQNVSLTTALEERGFSVNKIANAAYGSIKDKGYNKLSPSFTGVLAGEEPSYAPLVAASFNKEFAEEYGVLWGNDSLFNGLPFIWGPGLNLHRHAYNGRNGEYYSEDPVLSGYTGLAITRGALTKGLICAPKHFAFNDQESNRNGVAPFMNEQKARELELRSFQIAVEGGTLGLMTSFSRLGPVYVGAHEGLITGILHDEWGFTGYIITDMVTPASYMTWKESVVAGTTNFDTNDVSDQWADYMTVETNTFGGDATLLKTIKDRVHNTMWVYAQSNAMNGIDASSHRVEINTWWRVAYKTVYNGAIALTALCALMYVVSSVTEKRKER